MPALRTMTPIKPVKTERTHEENQERAYIAASRRSDRSLEARVESARRASEIHKKRTGRSLRVREEDVMNEEMYEEEDDDLPMQYRRINALNPHLSYAFAERLNNYVNGQIGVRSALQQAIAQSNQYQANQQRLNMHMQQGGCYAPSPSPSASTGYPSSPWPMNSPHSFQQNFPNQSTSFAAPQIHPHSAPNSAVDARRPSLPVHGMPMSISQSPGQFTAQPSVSHPTSPHGHSSRKVSQSPQQVPSPPNSVSTPIQRQETQLPNMMSRPYSQQQSTNTSMAPLTLKLPNETMQILDGTGMYNHGYPGSSGSPSRPKYSYNPNGKPKSSSGSSNGSSHAPEKQNPFDGLQQTFTTNAMENYSSTRYPGFHEPISAMSAPGKLDMVDSNAFGAYPTFDENFGNVGFVSGSETAGLTNDSFTTPDADAFVEFFDFQPSPE